jgi:hypothetical protein
MPSVIAMLHETPNERRYARPQMESRTLIKANLSHTDKMIDSTLPGQYFCVHLNPADTTTVMLCFEDGRAVDKLIKVLKGGEKNAEHKSNVSPDPPGKKKGWR